MKATLILYGSNSGNTKEIAKQIVKKLPTQEVTTIDVSKVTVEDIAQASNLILGTSTLGLGELQDDWDRFLPKFKKMDLSGKNIALFGLGDSESYCETFVDGIGIIYNAIKTQKCQFFGFTNSTEYTFSDSAAHINNQFVGLPIDEDNERELTEARITKWIKELEPMFN